MSTFRTGAAIVLTLAVLPAAAAADPIAAQISDADIPTVQAKLSPDSRLGVRGEATVQAGVPSNAWHASSHLDGARGPSDAPPARLVWGAPPGAGIGVSQLTVVGDGNAAFVWFVAAFGGPHGCAATAPAGYRPGESELIYVLPVPRVEGGLYAQGFAQAVFPIPLTLDPSPVKAICLYASANGASVTFYASGVSGPPVPAFVPIPKPPAG